MKSVLSLKDLKVIIFLRLSKRRYFLMHSIFKNIIREVPGGKKYLVFEELKSRFLDKTGWTLSAKTREPVDVNGKEIPWFNYSSIHFLDQRIRKEFSIFEYGSGNSTFWFSERAHKVISIEYDEKWFKKLENRILTIQNINLIFIKPESKEYAKYILGFTEEFDIVIIDGRDRVKCGLNSLKALKKDGVIIWDDAERERYKEGHDFLYSNGFKSIEFFGLGPIRRRASVTTIFYREENCLGI